MSCERSSKRTQESVVGFASEHATTDASGDCAHQTAVALLAVGIVRVAVRVVRVLLPVLVALLAASGRRPLLLLVGVARITLGLSA